MTQPPPPPTSPTAVPSLADLAAATDTRFVLAMFVDLVGKPCAKLVPVSAADALQADGVGFAGFAVGALGQQPHDPDVLAVPDVSTFTPIPFVKPGLGLVHCDPTVDGRPWPFAPRVILRSVLADLAHDGLHAQVGAELEYFLVRRDGSGALVTADPHDDADRPCYDARGLTRMYDHLTAVSTAMNSLGWGNYANDHEDGNGQFEQNFTHADALVTADRVISARYLVSMLAQAAGMTATFMPKPFTARTGSGLHLHLSLWDDAGAPAFPDAADTRGLGLSSTAYSFVGGLLEHARGLHALIAPIVNSYKRTGAATTTSGATWAPKGATYGGNDRTHFVRVPDGNRVELRGGDGSANPYLATAGALAAGLAGIRSGVDPGGPRRPGGSTAPAGGPGTDPVTQPAALPLPRTLLEATEAFSQDAVLVAAVDAAVAGWTAAGGEVLPERVSAYLSRRQSEEFFAWHDTVSTWETDRYLTAF